MSAQKSQEDLDFQAKLAKAVYKTSASNYGGGESKCTFVLMIVVPEAKNGINGKFTDVHIDGCVAFAVLRDGEECQFEYYWGS